MSHKIAMITGAGSGIGKAAALALAQLGFAIVFVGRRREPLDAAAQEVAKLNVKTLVAPTDVSNPTSVAELFQNIQTTFGRLDLLFNNAGVVAPAVPFEDLTFEQWKSVIDINLNGMFLCAQGAVRMMKQQNPKGGRIINNGSVSAHVPRPNSAPYTAAKHGVSGLTKSLALDGRAHNIACGQIDIGNASSEMTSVMGRGVRQANGELRPEPTINVSLVGETVAHMASLPLDANVLFTTIMATQMPFVGRG
jgi:NAD(P)-dependent dehydrogenase (short-subunit alcohol dehydrogenase family)